MKKNNIFFLAYFLQKIIFEVGDQLLGGKNENYVLTGGIL
jgi:hypothetical protein